MPRLNSPLIGDIQSTNLHKKINTSLNEVDLNWLGNDRHSKDSFEKYGTKANVNRVLLWLASKPDDFIRESLKGGILYSLLGQLTSDTNLRDWENKIKERFNAEFSQDLEIFLLKLTTDKTYKKLKIEMIVRDCLLNKTFPVSTEAAL